MTAFRWTDQDLRRALELRSELAVEGLTFSGVSTDSRTVEAGELYVALVGDRFDGHDFVVDALARGAEGAVVSRPVAGGSTTRLYPVDDTLAALGALASYRRRSIDVPVVAITGSSGKTTTKDFAAAAIGAGKKVHATRGNMNNRIGMPLTLLDVPADAEAVVLELGSNEPGEIMTLGLIARPDICVITTVGESHLEKLGSLEGVLSEKLDLLRCVASGGRCVVGDDPLELATRARRLCSNVRVAGWSEHADPDLRPDQNAVDVFGRYEFQWKGQTTVTPIPGRHAVTDALIALAIAELVGVSDADAVRGLVHAPTSAMRGEVKRIGDLTLIVDCYNANPQSVRAALDLLEGQGAASRRVAVLGTMLELGAASGRLHDEVLQEALERSVDFLVATGEFAEAAERAHLVGDPRVITAPDWRQAYPRLREELEGQDTILLKASRGIALEGIIPLLEKDFGAAPEESV